MRISVAKPLAPFDYSMDTTPTTADELAETLRVAAAQRQPVLPYGTGSHQHLGAAPPATALTLHTTALGRVLDYTPADLTITVEAGLTLGALQTMLADHGQWLPWDAPQAQTATIGGLLASAASGPLRLGYGTPRDWVLGMRVALGDGRLVKSGGKVVKNVAGYDTHKLHIGALGTLGVIAAVTFKLFPLPEAVASAIFTCPTRTAALALATQLRQPPLAPVSLVLCEDNRRPPTTNHQPLIENNAGDWSLVIEPALSLPKGRSSGIIVRFAGGAAAVERQLALARAAAGAAGAAEVPLTPAATEQLWQALAELRRPAPQSLLLRFAAEAGALAACLDLTADVGAWPHTLLAYPGVGLGYLCLEIEAGTTATQLAAPLTLLRAGLAAYGGYAVVEAAPPELHAGLDIWGPAPATIGLMRALKRQWDPQGILNPGRYLGGI